VIFNKIIKIVATRCQILRLKMHQIRFWLGLRPRPRWGSLQHSPDPLAGVGGGWLPPFRNSTPPQPFGPRYSVPSAPRLVATHPRLSGMSRICAMMFRVPAKPALGRQMSRISVWSWLPVLTRKLCYRKDYHTMCLYITTKKPK